MYGSNPLGAWQHAGAQRRLPSSEARSCTSVLRPFCDCTRAPAQDRTHLQAPASRARRWIGRGRPRAGHQGAAPEVVQRGLNLYFRHQRCRQRVGHLDEQVDTPPQASIADARAKQPVASRSTKMAAGSINKTPFVRPRSDAPSDLLAGILPPKQKNSTQDTRRKGRRHRVSRCAKAEARCRSAPRGMEGEFGRRHRRPYFSPWAGTRARPDQPHWFSASAMSRN